MAETTSNENGLNGVPVLRRRRSLWRDAWRRLRASNVGRIGMAIVAVFLLGAALSHIFWENDPKIDLD